MESYLIKLQYYKDSKSKNMNDFGILIQKSAAKQSIYKKGNVTETFEDFEDDGSEGSFTPKSVNSCVSGSVD